MAHAKVGVPRRMGSLSRFDSTRGLAFRVGGWQLFAHCSAGPRSVSTPIVVLVHGLEDSSDSMLGVARALAPDHRVYALDLPGFGRSEGPPEGLDVPGLADALAAWLEAMRLVDVTLAGTSTGCQVVARMAARYPARVARVILESPTLDPRARNSGRLFAAWLSNLRHAPLREGGRALRILSVNGPWRVWQSVRRVLADRIEDSLPLIAVPALVIHGALDAIAPRRWAAEVAQRLPVGRLQTVAGVSHGVSLLAPRACAAAVYRFVRDVPQRHAA
jgi:pimeloyl-ACP methyl ester carboxylesterase